MATKIAGIDFEISADTRKFKAALNDLNKSLQQSDKQVDSLLKSLRLDFDNTKFVQAQKLIQQNIDQSAQKADVLRQRLDELQKSGTVSPKFQKEFNQLQTELIKTETNVVQLKARMEELNRIRINQISDQVTKLGNSMTTLGNALAPVSALAASVVASIGAIGLSSVKTADDINTLSDQVNLSAKTFQRYTYLATQLDVSQSDLQTALRRTQAELANLATGDGSKALERLGLSSAQASLGMESNLDLIINALAGVTDSVEQASLANELFGDRMGARIIPLLKAGTSGLAQINAEFEQFNYLTDEQVDALSEFDNVMNRIKFAFETLKNQLGASLLPLMQQFADIIQNNILPFAQRLADAFASLSVDQQRLIVTILAVTAALAPALLIFGKMTTAIGGLIRNVASMQGAFTALASNPIFLAIAALVVALGYLYATNEQFRESINNLVATIGDSLSPLLNSLGALFSSLWNAIQPIIQMLGNILTPIIKTLTAVFGTWLGTISTIVGAILTLLKPAIDFILMALSRLIVFLSEPLIQALNSIADISDTVFTAIIDGIDSMVNFVEDSLNQMIEFINGIIRKINIVRESLGFDALAELRDVEIKTISESTQQAIGGSVATSSGAAQSIPSTQSTVNNYNNAQNIVFENGAIQIVNQSDVEITDRMVDDIVRNVNIKLAGQM